MSGKHYTLDGPALLQRLYDSEINIVLSWFWDGGIDIKIGDELNGYKFEGHASSVAEALLLLDAKVKELYPDSTYVKGRDK